MTQTLAELQKLEFDNNVSFVEACKALLSDSQYEGGLNERNECCYRSEDDSNRRCIMGRAFYGRIPEDSKLWDSKWSIARHLNPLAFEYLDELVKAAPYLNRYVAKHVQFRHDFVFGNLGRECMLSWDELLDIAKEADEEWNAKA